MSTTLERIVESELIEFLLHLKILMARELTSTSPAYR